MKKTLITLGMAIITAAVITTCIDGIPANPFLQLPPIDEPVQNTLVKAQTPFITNPQSAVYTIGKPAVPLEVTAEVSDNGTLSYQWYRHHAPLKEGGTKIDNETTTTYTPPTDTLGEAYYYAVVTNTFSGKTASAVSNTARIEVNEKVNAAVPVMSHPQHAECVYGGAAGGTADPLTISADVDDNGTLSYQWYSAESIDNEGGTEIPGATETSYTPSSLVGNAGDKFYYYAVITNTIDDNDDGGNKIALIRSETATITIVPKPVTLTLTISTKTYNGTAAATVGSRTINDNLDGGNLTVVNGTAVFEDPNAGSNKTVICSGWSLGGSASGNYVLEAQPSPTGNITAKTLTLSVPSGTVLTPLPGETSVTVTITVNGLVGSDTAAVSYSSSLPTGLTRSGATFTYNGTTAFINPTVTPNVSASAGANYTTPSASFYVTVYDGQADYTGASGTYDRRIPVRQSNITAFNTYANTANGLTRHYKLMQNVTRSGTNNWTAIGEYMHEFTGSFNGQGYTITDLNINTTSDYQGMFGYIGSGGMVRSLGLDNCSISGDSYVGGVAGFNIDGGIVQYCYTTGGISGNNVLGGVVGYNSGTVQDCYSTSSVSGYDTVGGVAGYNRGTVQNCYTTGNTAGDINGNGYIGGVVGRNNGTVQNCIARGLVAGYHYVGGIVGSGDGIVQSCVALNPLVGITHDCNSADFGRDLIARIGLCALMGNNYASIYMNLIAVDPVFPTPVSNANYYDGQSISELNYHDRNFWAINVGLDFNNVWYWSGLLPILRNVPNSGSQG
jgi:hypothetical protein